MFKKAAIIKNLPDLLSSMSQTYPNRIALIFGAKKLTYTQVHQRASRLASILKKEGIQRGNRVALLLDNSADFVTCYFATLMAEGIIVPINHMFKREEIKYILEDAEINHLITSSAYAELAQDLRIMSPSLKNVLYTNRANIHTASLRDLCEKQDPIEAIKSSSRGDDVAVFLYTSGTTGFPKAAMLTHKNLLSNIASSSKAIHITHKDALICFLPLFHSFAATVCMLMPFFNGARVVIMKSPRPVKKLLRSIRQNKVTIFVGIPAVYNILKEIKIPKLLPRFLLRMLNPIRLAISGAASLPVEVLEKFERKFGIPLLEGYGLTEASPVVSINPVRGKRKPGSIGKAIPGVHVRILDDHDRELPFEKTGELCVQGPNVMKGYFKKESDSAAVLKNGWLKTGDMAKIDREGYIYIVGRKKEMVNVRGLNVYPREIEEILYRNPEIKEAAVIGIPDPFKGEVPKGFVVPKTKDALTEQEILQFLKERLASYKIPKRIEIRDELPKNASGKILKRILEEEERIDTKTKKVHNMRW